MIQLNLPYIETKEEHIMNEAHRIAFLKNESVLNNHSLYYLNNCPDSIQHKVILQDILKIIATVRSL